MCVKVKLNANVPKVIPTEKPLLVIALSMAIQAAGTLQSMVLVLVLPAERAVLLHWVNSLVLIRVIAILLARKIILLQEWLVLRIRNARDLEHIRAARSFLNVNYQYSPSA
jgi:hypothetical protein